MLSPCRQIDWNIPYCQPGVQTRLAKPDQGYEGFAKRLDVDQGYEEAGAKRQVEGE